MTKCENCNSENIVHNGAVSVCMDCPPKKPERLKCQECGSTSLAPAGSCKICVQCGSQVGGC